MLTSMCAPLGWPLLFMRALLLCASSVVRDLRVTNSKKRDAEVQFQRHPLRPHSTCVRGFQQVWVWVSGLLRTYTSILRPRHVPNFSDRVLDSSTLRSRFVVPCPYVSLQLLGTSSRNTLKYTRGKGTPMSSISHFMTRGPCTGVFSSRKRGDDGSQATFTDLPNRDYHASPGTFRGTCISRSPDAEGAGSRPALMLNCRAQ